MKKVLLVGLCLGVMGCSSMSDKIDVLVSKNQINGVFKGTKEEYNPTIITLEMENYKLNLRDGLTNFSSVFYGRDGADYEAGVDLGLKYSINDFYLKGGLGIVYGSEEFKEQETKFNVHAKVGIGVKKEILGKKMIFGGVFNHRSNGSSITKYFGMENEPNKGINTLGLEFGFSF